MVAKTKIAEDYYKTYSGTEKWSDFRWLESSNYSLQNEISIYEDKLSIASINPEDQLSIIIQSKKIADTQRAIFEAAWKGAEKCGQVGIKIANQHISRSKLLEL